MIDNPRQDIALAGALRSYFCYLTAQELAVIKNSSKDTDLYTAVIEYRSNDGEESFDTELSVKIDKFLGFVDAYRKKASYMPIHELIKDLIYDTEYIVYAASKKNGKRRMANLDMLVNKAAEYENTSLHGLFNFLRYIDKLQKYEVDMGEADTMSENDDVVRIMSIHKSKGLEFPIVFVPDMDKKYNLQDTTERVNFHVKFGLGLDMVDTSLRLRKKSFQKRAMAEGIRLNSIGEELRVLYVALTRAVEKLILVGGIADSKYDSSMERWERRAQTHGGDYGYVYTYSNYLDLAAPVFFKSVTSAVLELRTVAFGRGDGNADSLDKMPETGTQGMDSHDVVTRDTLYGVDTGSEAQDGVASGSNSSDDGNDVDKNDDGNRELADIFRSRFDYQYPHELSTHLPGKFSVSELKHRDIDESQDEAVHIVQSERKKPVPEADGDTKKNMGAERGNAYHKVFELLDYNVNPDEDFVREFIHGLVLSGRMDAEYEKLVRAGKYVAFLNSRLGQRMKKAALSGRMYRERQFITGFPANRIRQEYEACDDIIMVQGIIDCCFEEEDGYVIVDYKTDHVEPDNAEEILKKRYTEQLRLYADALEQISDVKVKECIIYSVSVNSEIKL